MFMHALSGIAMVFSVARLYPLRRVELGDGLLKDPQCELHGDPAVWCLRGVGVSAVPVSGF